MTNHLAAGIAFFALGANALALTMHLLLNPTNRIARWFVGWAVAWIVVLGSQGMALLPNSDVAWWTIQADAVFLLPAVFLAFALVMARGWSAAAAGCLIGCWAVLLFLAGPNALERSAVLEYAWLGCWICGIAVMWGCSKSEIFPGKPGRLARRLLIGTLFFFAPISLVAALVGGNWYGLYIAPLSSVAIHMLVFLGVLYFRFYDSAVEVARRGAMASKAAEAERLAVLGELAASVAHEVRNPLTGIRSLTQRLADDSIPDDKRRQYARIILNETGRLEDIVSSLLNLAKGRSGSSSESTEVDLTAIFADLTALLAHRAEEAAVTLQADAQGVTTVTSADDVFQVLLNLLLNAIAHTPPGGTVQLLARRSQSDVEVVVRDDGPGIAPEDRERVCEPFHSRSDGVGIGLAVVRRLAREHGWRVAVGDSQTGGAEFSVSLAG